MNASDYQTKLPWPTKPARPAILGKRVGDVSATELAYAADAKAEYEAAIEAFERAKRAYNEDVRNLLVMLRTDLEADYGVVGHPRAEKLWALAWEHGHSSGYGDVINYYGEFAELIVGTVEA